MTPQQELTPEQERTYRVIQGLLNQASKAGTEQEAATYAAKAQEMLREHNLTEESVKDADTTSGKRLQEAVSGGYFQWQVDLWDAVAKLNFCLHWVGQRWDKEGRTYIHKHRRAPGEGQYRFGKWAKEHRLIGRLVNVRTTVATAQYLEQAINRTVSERVRGEDVGHHLGQWAVSFRKGCAARVVEHLQDRRQAVVEAEERAARAAQHRAKRAGTSTATAISTTVFARAEKDANVDFLMGEDGYSARERARKAEEAQLRARWRGMGEGARTAWAADHPEEAKAMASMDRYARRHRGGDGGGGRDSTDYSAYYSGYDAGAAIGLERQVGDGAGTKLGKAP